VRCGAVRRLSRAEWTVRQTTARRNAGPLSARARLRCR
jgi:hypothetical protein